MWKKLLSLIKLEAIFGKPAWQSWTAWGLLVWAVGTKAASEAVALGLLPPEAGPLVAQVTETGGQVLVALGIRRKL